MTRSGAAAARKALHACNMRGGAAPRHGQPASQQLCKPHSVQRDGALRTKPGAHRARTATGLDAVPAAAAAAPAAPTATAGCSCCAGHYCCCCSTGAPSCGTSCIATTHSCSCKQQGGPHVPRTLCGLQHQESTALRLWAAPCGCGAERGGTPAAGSLQRLCMVKGPGGVLCDALGIRQLCWGPPQPRALSRRDGKEGVQCQDCRSFTLLHAMNFRQRVSVCTVKQRRQQYLEPHRAHVYLQADSRATNKVSKTPPAAGEAEPRKTCCRAHARRASCARAGAVARVVVQ